MRVFDFIRSPYPDVYLVVLCCVVRVTCFAFLQNRFCSMLAEDAIKAAIKDLQDKGAVPKPVQHAEAA